MKVIYYLKSNLIFKVNFKVLKKKIILFIVINYQKIIQIS
jgi:hypothetical protein